MDIEKRYEIARVWFPMLTLIVEHLDRTVDIKLDTKGKEWGNYVKIVQDKLGIFWTSFYRGLGHVLSKQGVTLNSIYRSLSICHHQISETRMTCKPLERGLWNSGITLTIYDGEEYIDDRGFRRIGDIAKVSTMEDALRWCYLFSLYGIAWFKSFPWESEEYIIKRGIKGAEFMYQIGVIYNAMDEHDKLIVDGYCKRWANASHVVTSSIMGKVAKIPSESQLKKKESKKTFEEAILSMKNMKDWTEDDFWQEMTELYVKCKTAEDVRSVKQILELKAKTMGILEEKEKGGNNNFLLLTEKAVVALSGMGILGKRRFVNEG